MKLSPAKFAEDSAHRITLAAGIGIIVPTVCPAFMWISNQETGSRTVAVLWSRWQSGCGKAASGPLSIAVSAVGP